MLSSLKLNFSKAFLGTTSFCAIAFRADTGNNRKIVNFTFSWLYVRAIKVLGVSKFGSY